MDIKERLEQLDPETDAQELYEILNEMGISFKKTNCKKCRRDLYNIALEEIGAIDDASELSEFDTYYKYIPNIPLLWHKGDQYISLSPNTPRETIEEYLRETGAKGIFVLKKRNQ